jgi:uncharacterized membrane protein YdjX (TVP38/TMEM64 family)
MTLKLIIKKYSRLMVGIFIIAATAILYQQFDFNNLMGLESIRLWVDMFGPLGPLAFIFACIIGVILHLPEIVMIAIGALLFGGIEGFFYGWAGALIGSTCTFLFVRYFMRDVFQNSVAQRFSYFRNIDGFLAEKGFQTVLILRIALFMAPPLNWAIAVTRVTFSKYFAGSMLGIIPGVAITCYAAESIVKMESLSDLLSVEFAVPAFLFLALISASGLSGWYLLKNGAR